MEHGVCIDQCVCLLGGGRGGASHARACAIRCKLASAFCAAEVAGFQALNQQETFNALAFLAGNLRVA